MADQETGRATFVERRLLTTVRTVLLTVALTIQLGVNGYRVVATPPLPAAELAVYGTLLLVAVGCGAGLFSRARVLVPLRWVAVVVLLACSVVMSATLTLEATGRVDNWTVSVIGWYGLALLFDLPIGWIAAFLATHVMVLAWPVVAAGASIEDLSAMAVVVVAVDGFQLGVAFSAFLVRAIATAADRTAREEEQLRIEEEAAVATAANRARRYADLRVTTLPLLAGFASGDLDPTDPTVRRQCAVEAARMRRLFGENDDTEDRLVHELGAIIDVAERHGATVSMAVRGAPTGLPQPVRRALLAPISEALVTAGANARVTVLHTPEAVRVSVRCAAPELPVSRPDTVELTQTVSNGQLWLETAWRAR